MKNKIVIEVAVFAFLIGFGLAITGVAIIDAIHGRAMQTEPVHVPRPEFGTLPPACGHVYNVGKSHAWVACMLMSDKRQLPRDDI